MSSDEKPVTLRSVRIGRHQISYLKFLLESHEGLATPTTRENEPDVVDLVVAPDMAAELDDLIDALALETTLERIPPPDRSPL